jgi:hypothetical protein
MSPPVEHLCGGACARTRGRQAPAPADEEAYFMCLIHRGMAQRQTVDGETQTVLTPEGIAATKAQTLWD